MHSGQNNCVASLDLTSSQTIKEEVHPIKYHLVIKCHNVSKAVPSKMSTVPLLNDLMYRKVSSGIMKNQV